MMGKPLAVQYLPLLKAVTSVRDKRLQRKLLRVLCREQLFKRCICEIASNIVNQAVPLDTRQKRKLNRHTAVVRKLLKKKPAGFEQSGGFLNIAVPLVATLLGQLISK